MIHAVAWSCQNHYGCRTPRSPEWQLGALRSNIKTNPPSPNNTSTPPHLATSESLSTLIHRPLKYFSRMTLEARHSLCAAALALDATPWPQSSLSDTALLAAGHTPCHEANQQYFHDYVTNGRLMGRANLFIYTLPTSTLGEIAIPLQLTGPTLHLHSDSQPLTTLIHHAHQMLSDHESQHALVLYSNLAAAICLALADSPTEFPIPELPPHELAQYFASLPVSE